MGGFKVSEIISRQDCSRAELASPAGDHLVFREAPDKKSRKCSPGVLLVGCGVLSPLGGWTRIARIHPGDLKSVDLEKYHVAIFGDHALHVLQPASVRASLAGRQIVALICPKACAARKLMEWMREGFGEVVLPECNPST